MAKQCATAGSISNHNNDFRPKLHATQFSCHFITSVLKLQNLIAEIQELQDFGQYQNLPNNGFFPFILLQCDWLF